MVADGCRVPLSGHEAAAHQDPCSPKDNISNAAMIVSGEIMCKRGVRLAKGLFSRSRFFAIPLPAPCAGWWLLVVVRSHVIRVCWRREKFREWSSEGEHTPLEKGTSERWQMAKAGCSKLEADNLTRLARCLSPCCLSLYHVTVLECIC